MSIMQCTLIAQGGEDSTSNQMLHSWLTSKWNSPQGSKFLIGAQTRGREEATKLACRPRGGLYRGGRRAWEGVYLAAVSSHRITQHHHGFILRAVWPNDQYMVIVLPCDGVEVEIPTNWFESNMTTQFMLHHTVLRFRLWEVEVLYAPLSYSRFVRRTIVLQGWSHRYDPQPDKDKLW